MITITFKEPIYVNGLKSFFLVVNSATSDDNQLLLRVVQNSQILYLPIANILGMSYGTK